MTLDAKGEETRKAGAIRIVNEDKRELHVVSLAYFRHRQTQRRNPGPREEETVAPTTFWNTSSKEGTRSTLETARDSTAELEDPLSSIKKRARATAGTSKGSGRASGKISPSSRVFPERPFEIQIVDIAEKHQLNDQGIMGVALRTEERAR